MTGPRADVSIDEAMASMAEPKATDGTVKLDGANVPEALRGKTLDDVLKMNAAAMESLRISEEARKAAEARANQPAHVVVQPAAESPKPEPEPTEEQLREFFEKDPISAVRYMTNKARADAERNLEARLGPLGVSAVANAELAARQKFETEFRVLGKEITEVIDEIKRNNNGQAILSTPQGWDQVMSYVRGKPGNFEKIYDAKNKEAAELAARQARESEAGRAGFSPAPSRVAPETPSGVRPIGDAAGLDETQRKIADTFIANGTFKDYAEYAKWDKLGG